MQRVDVSIVIPTHNRRAPATRTLHALAHQCCSRTTFEVILVADGCTDNTAGLATAEWPMPVRVLEQSHAGPAAARNRGAVEAAGDLLVFLDDDIEVLPGFVAAHVAAHVAPDIVAIGYLPTKLQGRRDLFTGMLRAWWEAMFERMRDPGHRFTYADLLSGNFSVSRQLFERTGGFDEKLPCHEDYELGYRLIAAGARFQFVPAAAGWHHEHTDSGARARPQARRRTRRRCAGAAISEAGGSVAARTPAHAPHAPRAPVAPPCGRTPGGRRMSPTHCAGGCSAFWRRRGCAHGGAVCWMTACGPGTGAASGKRSEAQVRTS